MDGEIKDVSKFIVNNGQPINLIVGDSLEITLGNESLIINEISNGIFNIKNKIIVSDYSIGYKNGYEGIAYPICGFGPEYYIGHADGKGDRENEK